MPGSYEVYRAAFRQWGIIEADDIAELFDLVELFSLGVPSSRGDRIGIVTNSGGIGVFSADKVGELGLRMAVFELLHCPDIPPKVTINEAIEIGKKFSTANSGAFINGILDRVRLDELEKTGPSQEG